MRGAPPEPADATGGRLSSWVLAAGVWLAIPAVGWETQRLLGVLHQVHDYVGDIRDVADRLEGSFARLGVLEQVAQRLETLQPTLRRDDLASPAHRMHPWADPRAEETSP